MQRYLLIWSLAIIAALVSAVGAGISARYRRKSRGGHDLPRRVRIRIEDEEFTISADLTDDERNRIMRKLSESGGNWERIDDT